MSLVAGIEKFKEAMAGYEDCYVLIGGGACSILLNEAGADFRLTKDLDVVVLVDDCPASFAQAVWDFVRDGGYRAWTRREGSCSYYRFALPSGSPNVGKYPGEIELFSRHPSFTLEDENSHVAPMPFDESVSSLSAIILEDGYYEFIRSNAVTMDGVSVLSALHIIPLKMRAHVDNHRLHDEGIHISEKVLKKHRNDVMELSGLLSADARLELEGQLRADAELFLNDLEDISQREMNRKRRATIKETANFLRGVYL